MVSSLRFSATNSANRLQVHISSAPKLLDTKGVRGKFPSKHFNFWRDISVPNEFPEWSFSEMVRTTGFLVNTIFHLHTESIGTPDQE
jgi:hypothetical protein